MGRRLLFLLFFASGCSGLIYESIWSRYIRQLVGSAAAAQVLVLALFMGGMSIGALLAGRMIRRIRSPIAVYGVIEGLIGAYALAFPHLFGLCSRLTYDVLLPAVGGGTAVALAKWGVASILILPPCVLLGMTFPLMSVGILRRHRKRGGEVLAVLYFVNSLGAAIGAVVSGFGLVPSVGLPGALMVAAAINIVIMIVAVQDREVYRPIVSRATTSSLGLVALYLTIAFGTGLSSFLYEVGWIRLLSMILGSATHSFEVMLSAFVLGLALGGLWVRRRIDRYPRPERTLAIVQIAMGVCAIATLPAYLLAVDAMGWMMTGTENRTLGLWYQFNVVRYLICLLIMLPATFCAGMTLPLLTHVMLKRGQPEASVGYVYGLNTLGAIAGAMLGGLVLMPLVHLKGLIVIGALVDLLLGIRLLRGEAKPLWQRAVALVALLVVGGGLAFPIDPAVLSSTVFRHGKTNLPANRKVLSYVDGRTASVSVVENMGHEGSRVIYTNGKPDASVMLNRWPEDRDPMLGPEIAGDEPNQFLVALIPLMVNPKTSRAALIGFGSGVTCHTLLGSPKLERLDTVEIEPEMVRGARHFEPVNFRAYTDPRSHIYFDDAKAYFAAAGSRYDVIISEPTNPWVSGVSSLFTIEFYKEVKRYLNPGGLLAQWIQGYELSDALLLSVLAALDQEFEDYLVVRIGGRDWVIIASPKGSIGELSPEPLGWEDTQASFDLLGIRDMGQIDGLVVANRRLLHPYLATKTPNRDSHPILDTGAERERFLQSSAEFLHSLRFTPAPVLEVLGRRARRPYVPLSDRRDPHIFYQLELATLLMRRHTDPDFEGPATLTTDLMRTWRAAEAPGRLSATFDVYRETAPHLDVRGTGWWREVMSSPTTPEVDLLDALAARDGERLLPLTQRDDLELPAALRTIAGAVALELTHATPTERRAYADEQMSDIGNGDTNEEIAYQVIRAFVSRDGD